MKRWAIPLLVAAGLLAPAATRAQGPEVQDFNFYNTDLHLVLKALAEVTGLTFVEDAPISGKVTVHVAQRSGVDEVLATILKPLGLSWRAVGTVYHIGFESKAGPAPGRPGYIQKSFPLRYASAGEVSRQLRKLLRARGIVSVDLGMNQVTATIPPALLTDVENAVKAADVEVTKQIISVRVKLLEVTHGATQVTDATFAYQNYNSAMGVADVFATPLNNLRLGTGGSADTGQSSLLTKSNVYLPLDENTAFYPQALTFKVGGWGIDQIIARMKLQASFLDVDDVADADVIVLEGQEATIKLGGQLPINALSKYQDVGVSLTVKPQAAKDGFITMDVDALQTRIIRLPALDLDNREVKTTVTLVNGDTGRLGGLLSLNDSTQEDKVPILGDLPLIGIFFKHHQSGTNRHELVVLISPSIVEDVPPHGRRSPGIAGLVAWVVPGSTDVMLDWSEDVPVDNVGIFKYKVYRDTRPIVSTARLQPLADAVDRSMTGWLDETPKRRGVTYYYCVTAEDGAGNATPPSNSPAVTVPKR